MRSNEYNAIRNVMIGRVVIYNGMSNKCVIKWKFSRADMKCVTSQCVLTKLYAQTIAVLIETQIEVFDKMQFCI